MLTVEEAREGILSRIEPLGIERVDVVAALGRVLAEPVVSRLTIPPWSNSSMDGYAIRSTDTNGSVELLVVGKIIAGVMPARALGAAFPTVRAFVGAETFARLAPEHWRAVPPTRGDIDEWGDGFASWLEAQASLALAPNVDAYLVLARVDLQANNLAASASDVSNALRLEPANAAALGMKTALAARGQALP